MVMWLILWLFGIGTYISRFNQEKRCRILCCRKNNTHVLGKIRLANADTLDVDKE
jgi:hypothetical protein